MFEFMKKLEDDSFDMFKSKGAVSKIVNKFYKSRNGGFIINNGLLLYPPKINRRNTPAGIFLNKLEGQLKEDFNIN